MSDANNQTCTVAIFHNVKSRFGGVLSFYSKLSSLHEIISFRNGATYNSSVLYFDFYTKYWTTCEFLLFWKSAGPILDLLGATIAPNL